MSQPTTNNTTAPTSVQPRSPWIPVLITVVITAVIVGGGVWWWQYTKVQQLNDQLKALQALITNTSAQNTAAQNDLGVDSSSDIDTSNWIVYGREQQYGLEFLYPSDWYAQEPSLGYPELFLSPQEISITDFGSLDPVDPNSPDPETLYVQFSTVPLDGIEGGPLTQNEYIDTFYSDHLVREPTWLEINGIQMLRVERQTEGMPPALGYIFFDDRGKAYDFTIFPFQPEEPKLGNYYNTFEAILSTFVFTYQ